MSPSAEALPTPARVAVNEWLELGFSGIHGHGGFARRDIRAGTPVVEYLGERIDKAEAARRCVEGNVFIFTVNDEWDLDGAVDWNPARLLNHSCEPNCEAEQDGDRIWIVARRDIPAGEELTFNYGYELEEYRDHPCGCRAAGCVGYIVAEEFHPQVRQQLAREADPGALARPPLSDAHSRG